MKEYTFEYTKRGSDILLVLLSFAVIAISVAIMIELSAFSILSIILSIIFGLVFGLLNKNRVKSVGKAILNDNSVDIELSESIHIDFNQLKYYYAYDGKNGSVLTLGLLTGEKTKMQVNNNFCDDEQFKTFSTSLQLNIEHYKVQSNANIIHLTSVIARKNSKYVLAFFTALAIALYVFTKMPVMIIAIALTLPLIINWFQYFKLKRDNKLVDF